MSYSRPLPLPNAVPPRAAKFGIRNFLRVSLWRQGFAVWLAADGQEAVELYWRHYASIDVVLLDVRMPELDGPRTLMAPLMINPALRSCFMSGDWTCVPTHG